MKLIPLTQGKFAKVDDADFDWLNQWKWHVTQATNNKTWYATRTAYDAVAWAEGRKAYRLIQMHRLLCPGKKVDHKNLNGLDNRRDNLRPATNSQSSANRGRPRNNTSGYKGVGRGRDNWAASIRVNKKLIYLGGFRFKTEAARAYDRAALKYFGPFARLNFS